jgi:hypothetical protein
VTIIIGVLCEDGIVLGSDSSATFGPAPSQGHSTIEQPAQKVFTLGEDLVFAGTGSMGAGQRLRELLAGKKTEIGKNKATEIGKLISQHFINDLALTQFPKGHYGALVACGSSVHPFCHLIEFDIAHFQPEVRDSDLWFSCMGSGQPIADPFLGFIKRVLFEDKRPKKLNEGVFAVHWTLRQAIDLNTGGIKGPAQIATLTRGASNKGFSTKMLAESDLLESEGMVKGIEDCIRDYRTTLSGQMPSCAQPMSAPPKPPEPPKTPG